MERDYRIVKDVGSEALAIVPLGTYGDHGEAILSKKDLDELIAMGMRTNWTVNNGSVVATGKRSTNGHISVARVLIDAKPGQRVRFKDKNTRNLRRENLEVIPGYSVRHDRLYV